MSRPACGSQLSDYQHERNMELVGVQGKVDMILRRKTALQEGLKEQLVSLQLIIKAKEADLERHRKAAYA